MSQIIFYQKNVAQYDWYICACASNQHTTNKETPGNAPPITTAQI